MRNMEHVYNQIREICAEERAVRVMLFGSRARGTAEEKSDIDLAVWGCPDFPHLEDRLDNELWSLLQLDVVNMDESSSHELLEEVLKDGKVLYEEVR
ncbi:nucleotidyltransferase family protein [Collinsella phocaeensis]|uniref:nucleotidyltransferase family protein n=1 Tax=Collinsella phocaeensis TaxID=1871016 RepID=UPI000A946A7F|nr:nucleotidyltransferase domain-containing protein [Collinsella phocaeensis]